MGSKDGVIESKLEDWKSTYMPISYNLNTKRMASVLATFKVKAHQKIQISFYLAWHFATQTFQISEVLGVKKL